MAERRCRPSRNQPAIANSINSGNGIINRFGEPTTIQVNQPSNSPAGQGQQEQTFCSQERQQVSFFLNRIFSPKASRVARAGTLHAQI